MKNTKQHKTALSNALRLVARIEIAIEGMAEAKKCYRSATNETEQTRYEFAYNWHAGRRLKAIADYAEVMQHLITGVMEIETLDAATY